MHIAYLDEFGHIGPYVSRDHPNYNTHPIFGFGGIVLPAERVRDFGSFFQNLKAQMLAWEIARDGAHPATWEKKGSALLTTRNFENYLEVRKGINRILNRLDAMDGKVFFYGQVKQAGGPDLVSQTSRQRYDHGLIQSIVRTCNLATWDGKMMMVLDEVDDKSRLDAMAAARGFIYGDRKRRGHKMIEAPMQVESHLYPTVQAADWICALIGRISAFRLGGEEWAEFAWADKYFGERLGAVTCRGSKIHDPLDESQCITRGVLMGTATHLTTEAGQQP